MKRKSRENHLKQCRERWTRSAVRLLIVIVSQPPSRIVRHAEYMQRDAGQQCLHTFWSGDRIYMIEVAE